MHQCLCACIVIFNGMVTCADSLTLFGPFGVFTVMVWWWGYFVGEYLILGMGRRRSRADTYPVGLERFRRHKHRGCLHYLRQLCHHRIEHFDAQAVHQVGAVSYFRWPVSIPV